VIVWVRRGFALAALSALVACSVTTRSTEGTSPTTVDAPVETSAATVSTASGTTASGSSAPSTTTVPPLQQCVQAWPLRDRVAMLVWPAVKGSQWAQAQALVRDQHVGGVLLMAPDAGFAADLAGHLAELDALSPHGLLVATDEEGGAVQRLRVLQPLASQEELSQRPAAEVQVLLADHARLVAAAGVDVVLGPVVDVRPVTGSDPLGEHRLFVGGPAEVAGWGSVYVAAWQAAGLTPVLKHFPGHGSASSDSHDGRAVTPPLEALRDRDLVPYRVLAGSGAAVMIGHIEVPGLTDGLPASLSPAAVALLRNDLGWGDALVITDALGMGGVGRPVPDAAVAAIAAGVDVVLFTGADQTAAVIDAITAAVGAGVIDVARVDEAAARVAGVLAAHGRPCG
jgi:beta-N-acetylhexosaminidase